MDAQKFHVKLYVERPETVDLDALIPVFHSFIRDKKVGESVIDVADYQHVAKGPGVVLIGHASDYYLELGEGRPGLLYTRKRDAVGSLEERVCDAFRRALAMAHLLEQEPSLELRFGTSEILFRAVDRLHSPNDDATFEALRPALGQVLEKLGGAYTLTREGEPREPFTVRATRTQSDSVDSLRTRL